MPTLTAEDAISRQLALISISVGRDNDAVRGIVASVRSQVPGVTQIVAMRLDSSQWLLHRCTELIRYRDIVGRTYCRSMAI